MVSQMEAKQRSEHGQKKIGPQVACSPQKCKLRTQGDLVQNPQLVQESSRDTLWTLYTPFALPRAHWGGVCPKLLRSPAPTTSFSGSTKQGTFTSASSTTRPLLTGSTSCIALAQVTYTNQTKGPKTPHT